MFVYSGIANDTTFYDTVHKYNLNNDEWVTSDVKMTAVRAYHCAVNWKVNLISDKSFSWEPAV